MLLKARPYQNECNVAFDTFWDAGHKRLAAQLATGLGKTVIFSLMAYNKVTSRVLVLVHRDFLIKQATDKVHSVAPHLTVGVIKGRRKELGRDITIASVQTLGRLNHLEQFSHEAFQLIIIDEAHHSAAEQYRRIIEWFGGFDEKSPTRVAGFTATLDRQDGKGLGNIFEHVVFTRDILWGIHNNDSGPCKPGNGYLVDFRATRVHVDGLNLSRVKVTRGDFSDGALGDALADAHIGEAMLKWYVEKGQDRPGVAFLPTVQTATDVADIFNDAGVRVGLITGTTSEEERNLLYKMMRVGDIKLLINCMVLTEGFDLEMISLIMIARPTKSPSLYIQMAGRGARQWPGKSDCLIADFVGATDDLRLCSIANLSRGKLHPDDMESLGEAHERQEGELPELPASEGSGQIIGESIAELFAKRSSAWLQTINKGYWFIPAGDRYYCLLPEDASFTTYKLGYYPTGKNKENPKKLWEGLTLGYGMALAESAAETYDPTIAVRNARWRKTKQGSKAQLDFAKGLGIQNPEDMRRGELSDQISKVIVSRNLDRYTPREPVITDG